MVQEKGVKRGRGDRDCNVCKKRSKYMVKLKLPPIIRARYTWWQTKGSIKIKKTKKRLKLLRQLYNACTTSQDCMCHQLNAALFGDRYRTYRRGKNRCKRCGCKII